MTKCAALHFIQTGAPLKPDVRHSAMVLPRHN